MHVIKKMRLLSTGTSQQSISKIMRISESMQYISCVEFFKPSEDEKVNHWPRKVFAKTTVGPTIGPEKILANKKDKKKYRPVFPARVL